jgi:hypothetical protein
MGVLSEKMPRLAWVLIVERIPSLNIAEHLQYAWDCCAGKQKSAILEEIFRNALNCQHGKRKIPACVSFAEPFADITLMDVQKTRGDPNDEEAPYEFCEK